jgi:hypothetical protein
MQHGNGRMSGAFTGGNRTERISVMPGKHTSKEKRKARHIEKGYEKKGVSHREAEHRAWATVNKQD